MNAVLNADIDMVYYNKLKQGFDVFNNKGELIKNDMVTNNPSKARSYAFCSDTAYNESMINLIKDTTVLYHESTFLEKNKKIAFLTKHSTAKQAANIARQAEVGMLILGHFSTRYDDLIDFKLEAQTIFENVELAEDGKQFDF